MYSYEESLIDLLYLHGSTPHIPATEQEAFSGNILGRRGGIQGKPLRELSNTMRDRLQSIIEHTRDRILNADQGYQDEDLIDLGDPGDREREALPRAICAFSIGVRQLGKHDRNLGHLKSFTYVAASVCMVEFKRYLITTYERHTFPTR